MSSTTAKATGKVGEKRPRQPRAPTAPLPTQQHLRPDRAFSTLAAAQLHSKHPGHFFNEGYEWRPHGAPVALSLATEIVAARHTSSIAAASQIDAAFDVASGGPADSTASALTSLLKSATLILRPAPPTGSSAHASSSTLASPFLALKSEREVAARSVSPSEFAAFMNARGLNDSFVTVLLGCTKDALRRWLRGDSMLSDVLVAAAKHAVSVTSAASRTTANTSIQSAPPSPAALSAAALTPNKPSQSQPSVPGSLFGGGCVPIGISIELLGVLLPPPESPVSLLDPDATTGTAAAAAANNLSFGSSPGRSTATATAAPLASSSLLPYLRAVAGLSGPNVTVLTASYGPALQRAAAGGVPLFGNYPVVHAEQQQHCVPVPIAVLASSSTLFSNDAASSSSSSSSSTILTHSVATRSMSRPCATAVAGDPQEMQLVAVDTDSSSSPTTQTAAATSSPSSVAVRIPEDNGMPPMHISESSAITTSSSFITRVATSDLTRARGLFVVGVPVSSWKDDIPYRSSQREDVAKAASVLLAETALQEVWSAAAAAAASSTQCSALEPASFTRPPSENSLKQPIAKTTTAAASATVDTTYGTTDVPSAPAVAASVASTVAPPELMEVDEFMAPATVIAAAAAAAAPGIPGSGGVLNGEDGTIPPPAPTSSIANAIGVDSSGGAVPVDSSGGAVPRVSSSAYMIGVDAWGQPVLSDGTVLRLVASPAVAGLVLTRRQDERQQQQLQQCVYALDDDEAEFHEVVQQAHSSSSSSGNNVQQLRPSHTQTSGHSAASASRAALSSAFTRLSAGLRSSAAAEKPPKSFAARKSSPASCGLVVASLLRRLYEQEAVDESNSYYYKYGGGDSAVLGFAAPSAPTSPSATLSSASFASAGVMPSASHSASASASEAWTAHITTTAGIVTAAVAPAPIASEPSDDTAAATNTYSATSSSGAVSLPSSSSGRTQVEVDSYSSNSGGGGPLLPSLAQYLTAGRATQHGFALYSSVIEGIRTEVSRIL